MNLHTNHNTMTAPLAAMVMLGTMGAIEGAADAADLHVPGQYPTITVALANASNGDSIILEPGVYPESVDLGAKQVSIIGSGGADVTTINAFGLGSCLRITGGQSLDTVIEGITFTGGVAPRGGGIFIDDSSATVRHCKFLNNDSTVAGGDGGGLFIETGSLVLEDSEFIGNAADDVGGGAYFRTDTNVTVKSCHFEGNVANRGGGMAALGPNDLTLLDCTYLMNGTLADTADAGAIWALNADILADRCHFEGNVVFDDGSAVFAEGGSDVELRNSVFLNNNSESNGTIYSWQSSTSIDVTHCTMAFNTAQGVACLRSWDGGVLNFRNGIMASNTNGSGQYSSADSNSNVTYSIVANLTGEGNISQDPLLNIDLTLQAGSPAIDAADTYALLGDDPRDFVMNPRAVDDPDSTDVGVSVYGMTADMGAFEFQPEGGGGPDLCPADVNDDGVVNVDDLLMLLAAWGSCF